MEEDPVDWLLLNPSASSVSGRPRRLISYVSCGGLSAEVRVVIERTGFDPVRINKTLFFCCWDSAVPASWPE